MKNRFAAPLALLLSYWLVQSQAIALVGGPFDNLDTTNVTGNYAGIMVPISAEDDIFVNDDNAEVDVDEFVNTNAMGLFTVEIQEQGFTSGTLVFFINGTGFIGTIDMIGGQDEQQLIGVYDADATSTQVVSVPFDDDITSVPQLAGQIAVDVINNSDFFSTNLANIDGTSRLLIIGDIQDALPSELDLAVRGYKQSELSTTTNEGDGGDNG